MPRKSKEKIAEEKKQSDDKLLATIRKRANKGISADKHNRDHIAEAKRFLNLQQWHGTDLEMRKGRPALVIDRINPAIDQAVGDQRENLPGIKVRPLGSGAEVDWAMIREGKIRHIVSRLDAKVAINKASEHQLQGGRGYLRVITDYESPKTRRQEIFLVPVYNELSVVFDPAAVAWDRMDGNWCIVYARIGKDSYKEQYGQEPRSLEVDTDIFKWRAEEEVIVAEYFVKEFEKKKVRYLADGTSTEDMSLPTGQYELDKDGKPYERTIHDYKIYRYKVDGAEILEEKKLWPSKYWPIIPVFGKQIDADGKTYDRGITKNAMDPQRMYNYFASAGAEQFALASRSRTYVTPQMIAGHEDQWNNANRRLDPYLLVNPPDPEHPEVIAFPHEAPPPQASSAIVQGLMQAAEDIRFTTNKGLASLGQPSNETSGLAIRARQHEGDVADYAYTDNLNLAFLRVGEIILELFPIIYDTNRSIMVVNEDGVTNRQEEINRPASAEEGVPMSPNQWANDMTVGEYQAIVDSGPSYSTQRQEVAAFYLNLINHAPETMKLLGDIMFKYQDVMESQTASNRFRAMMIKTGMGWALTKAELEDLQKKLPMAFAPQQPNPQMIADIKEKMTKALKNMGDAELKMSQAKINQQQHDQIMMENLAKLGTMFQAYISTQGQQGQPEQQQLPQMPQMGGIQ